MNKLLISLVCAIVLAGWAPVCFGQATDANLVGTIVDASGAAVPNATVEITHLSTGIKTTASTNMSGQYRFNNIPVGGYSLKVDATGFASSTVKGVEIELAKTSTVNVTVQVGAVATTLEVSSYGAVIDTTTSQVQTNFDSQQIVNLPIIESSTGMFGALQTSLLGAGVTSNGGVGQGTGPSVGGQRPTANNFMIEGVDNNNLSVTGPLVYVPTEATAEFTLLQNQFSSEFGHSAGGQFNTIVKSGGNEFHGDAYEYLQNRNLNALDAQYARLGYNSPPRYDMNKFGGTVGGPIIKDKLFYFGNFEYAPFGQASAPASPVYGPTAAGFALLDQMNNAGTISKTNYSIFKQYVPAAGTASKSTLVNGVSIPTGVLDIAGPFYTNMLTYLASVDYNPTNSDQIRGRFISNRLDQPDNAANLPTFWATTPYRYYVATLSAYHTFSPTVTNEIRLAYNRYANNIGVGNFKFPGLDVFPNIQINDDLGLQIGPDPNGPQFTIQNTYQLVENVNWTKGKHTFKFGFDGRDLISPQSFTQRQRGDYQWTDLQGYLSDTLPDYLAERNLGLSAYYGNLWATYLYATDTWRIKNNLTISLGLRWERTTVPLSDVKNWNLDTMASTPGLITFRGPSTSNKNFAPRVGIAYSPGSSGRTSIRAGFGMAYDVVFQNVGITATPPQLSATYDAENYPNLFKAPFLANGGIYPGSLPGGTTFTNPADARANTSSYLPPNQTLPYAMSWSLGVQHVFHNDYTLESRYMGTKGVHLVVQDRINMQPRVTPTAYLPTYLTAPSQAQLNALPLTLSQLQAGSDYLPAFANAGYTAAITGFVPWGNSIYHGWANQLTRRFSNGMQFVAAYTWSHNMDDSTATHFSTLLTPRRPQDFQNLRNDWSSSALDRRQRFTFSWVYESRWFNRDQNWFKKNLIGNWRFVGTYTAETGELADAQSGTDSNLNGDSAGDRAIINPAGQANLGSGVTALKNSAGQTVAYLANNPNARYIQAGQGALANGGRNTVQMPGINNFDVSLGKKFNIAEKRSFELRADFSNLFNHPQFTPGYINSVRLTSQTTNNTFLLPSNPGFQDWAGNFPSNARSGQIVAKFVF